MIKIVHCADIHAGKPASKILEPKNAGIRRREIESSFFEIVKAAEEESAHILIISGDLFEHRYARPAWVKEASEALGTIPKTRVFIAPGNHDPAFADSLYRGIAWPSNVTVFLSKEIQKHILPDTGVTVYGAAWTSYRQTSPLLRGFSARDETSVNIMALHGQIVGRGASETAAYLPISLDDVAGSALDYLALGHIHAPSSVQVGRTTVVYPGCPEPLDLGDVGPRGIYVVTITEKGDGDRKVEATFRPTSKRQIRRESLDVTGFLKTEQVRNAILALAEPSTRSRDMWAVDIEGRADPDLDLELPAIETELSREFFSLRLFDRHRPDYDIARIGGDGMESLEAHFVRYLQKKVSERTAQGDYRGAEVANLALYYGLDALREGRILPRGRRWE